MSLSIKTKQVAGVTLLVGLTVIPLGVWHVSTLVRLMLSESQARAELIANTTYQRAADMVAAGTDLTSGLRADAGLRSIMQGASGFDQAVAYVAVVDNGGIILAHFDESQVGLLLPAPVPELRALLGEGLVAQVKAVLTPGGKNLEVRLPLLQGGVEMGSIRVGISTLLLRTVLWNSLVTQIIWVALALVGALLLATVLAQVIVRPIHVIRSGLARLGRGQLDVDVNLPADAELADLGDSFKAVSARLAAD